MNIQELVRANPSYTIGALMHLFGDGRAFNCIEAPILNRLAKQYEEAGYLSDPEISAIARVLPKYHREFIDLCPVNVSDSKPEGQSRYSKKAWLDGNKIRFQTDDPADVIKTKKVFNRRYAPKADTYSCTLTLDGLVNLKEWGFGFTRELRRILRGLRLTAGSIKGTIDIPNLPGTLRDYQNTAVSFLEMKNGRALIGDDMGLGKTVEALAYCNLHPEHRPLLIITTGSSKLNWCQEVNIWLPGESVHVCYGRTPDINKITTDVAVINYDILTTAKGKKWFQVLLDSDIKILISDECHKVKNPQAKRTKAFQKLARDIKIFIAMSGTPMGSRPVEMFTLLNLLAPWLFPSYWDYAKRYCGAFESPWGWDVSGASNIAELNKKLQYIMIRRKKSEVLTELPKKVRSVIPVEYDEKIYNKGLQGYRRWKKGTWVDKEGEEQANADNPAAAMVEIGKLKLAAAESKMPAVIKWIDEYLQDNPKLVVFCEHKEIQQMLADHFKKIAVLIVGGMTPALKDKAVTDFQKCENCDIKQDKHSANDNPCNNYQPGKAVKLLIGSKAAIEAITLTAANSTCTVEFWWLWTDHEQAEDRVYRMHQEHDSVNAFYLIANGTIESDIIKILDRKRDLIDKTLDGIETKDVDMLAGLLAQTV